MIIGDPAWRVLDQDGILVATAGADQILYLDDVPGEVAAELQPCWIPDASTSHSLSADAHRAIAQLQPVGVLHFDVPCPPRPVLGFAGDDVGVASRVAGPAHRYLPHHPCDPGRLVP